MVYEIVDIPEPLICENCNQCMRVKLMEMGLIIGQDIQIQKKQWGLYIINLLSKDGHVEQTLAMGEDELSKVCLKEKPQQS
jgi:Fe2+ transport system protein FeoA